KAKNRLSDEELKTALSREGQTMASYRTQVKSELEKSEIINRRVRTRVNITNDDVERYYKLNSKSYRAPERARIRHILLAVPQNASSEQVQAAIAKALEERITKRVKTDLRRKHRVDVKLPSVVFKAEDTKEGTVDSLMAKSTRLDKKQDRGWFSFLNPFKETDTSEEDPNSPLYGRKIVTVFGLPLGTADATDDVPDILSTPPEKSAG